MTSRLSALALAALLIAGCREKMAEHGKLEPLTGSAFFSDGRTSREPPEGTVARETPSEARPPVTPALLARGRERFDIYCAVCHGRAGDADGIVVRRGFPSPPSYHTEKLRKASDLDLYGVISNGDGLMFPYGDRVRPADRWAIVAYIRALQLARVARLSEVPAAERARLEAMK